MPRHHSAPTSGGRILSEGELLAEIACFEARLVELDDSGDSAYEKALARAYEREVGRHRARLAALRRAHG